MATTASYSDDDSEEPWNLVRRRSTSQDWSKSLNLEDSLKKQEKVKMIVMRSLRGRFRKPRDVSGAVSAQFSIHKTPYF
jgi:hypothetical protein